MARRRNNLIPWIPQVPQLAQPGMPAGAQPGGFDTNIGCVYVALNLINNKLYVGQTFSGLDVRKRGHKNVAVRGKKTRFAGAIRKYGFNSFAWYVLFRSSNQFIISIVECFYILLWNTQNNTIGYNVTVGGEGSTGATMSPESRQKMSAAKKGRKLTPEQVAVAIKHLHSPEAKAKQREALKNYRKQFKGYSKETLTRMRTSATGRKISEETKCKLSKANRGKKASDETKARMSAALKGKRMGHKVSIETRAKISESLRGKKQSSETNAKRSESLRAYNRNRRLLIG